MTHHFNAQNNEYELFRRGLPRIGELVWCSEPQREEHMATVMEYRQSFTEVRVKWQWDSGAQWRNGTWVNVGSIRTLMADDVYNLRNTRPVNYEE